MLVAAAAPAHHRAQRGTHVGEVDGGADEGGDREGAVALMDEKTEMRVHVGDSVQMLRGIERFAVDTVIRSGRPASPSPSPGRPPIRC